MSCEGANSAVLQDAIAKQFKDCLKGNDVVGLQRLLDNLLDLVPEIKPLRIHYRQDLTWFYTALAKCGKDRLGLPNRVREDDLFAFMGFHCPKCEEQRVSQMMLRYGRTCSRCNTEYTSLYLDVYRKLLQTYHIEPTPEAVLLFEAYERRANAICALFEAVRLVMVWQDLSLNDEYAYYFEMIYYGVVTGESKEMLEIKQLLQFLARANLARNADGKFVVDIPAAKNLIRLGFDVVKWGALSNQLLITGVDDEYCKAMVKYGEEYSVLNAVIRQANFQAKQVVSKPKEEIVELAVEKRKYYPWLVLPEQYWERGRIPKQYKLYPEDKPDIYPRPTWASIDMWYGLPGCGKTTGMDACICDGIVNHDEFVITLLADKSNALTLASLPLWKYEESRTGKFVKRLFEMGVTPSGVPTVTFNVVTKEDESELTKDMNANPPTIWDRIVYVDNYRDFVFDWKYAVDQLTQVAEVYGIKKPQGISREKYVPPGILNFRNLYRYDTVTKENKDVQVALCLLPQIDKFRKNNLSKSFRLFCDEFSAIAPATSNSPDTYDSGNLTKETVKDIRRDDGTIEGSTQQISDVNTELRNNVRNLFFRNLPKTGDKSRSQIDIVLSSFQVEDESVIPVIKDLNDKGRLRKGFFWVYLDFDHVPKKPQVVKFSPPCFAINDPGMCNRDVFELFQKKSVDPEVLAEQPFLKNYPGGQQILLKSWKDVPFVKMGSNKSARNKAKIIYT
jgi:hypothetical protein